MGAGLSGIGAACHMQRNCPDNSYIILEARKSIGGTWDLFLLSGYSFRLGYVHVGV